jgi:uncharacterized protein YdaU (DUF1376 family)
VEATKQKEEKRKNVHLGFFFSLQEEQDEHGKGKSDKRITESKARQKESTTLCTNLAN